MNCQHRSQPPPNFQGYLTTGTVQHMAVVPLAAQDSSKAATEVRSGSAVESVSYSDRLDPLCRLLLTGLAGKVKDAVNADLAALRSVDGRAEVDGSAPDSGGRGEGCEGSDGGDGELHFGGCCLDG